MLTFAENYTSYLHIGTSVNWNELLLFSFFLSSILTKTSLSSYDVTCLPLCSPIYDFSAITDSEVLTYDEWAGEEDSGSEEI